MTDAHTLNRFRRLVRRVACGIAALSAVCSAAVVVPAAAWSDQNGDLVQLHGIGILEGEGKFYAYGQDMRRGEPYHAVATYSSRDLVNWTRHDDALSPGQTAQLQAEMFDDPKFVVERPKVLHNRRTGKYVMLFHFDTAKRNQSYIGVATCDRPDGRFEYVRKFKPQGNRSGDMGVFVDPNDGQAYLIAEDRLQVDAPKTARTVIYQLNDDYTDVRPGWNAVLPPVPMRTKYPSIEAPTIVYEPKDKLYYVFGSLLTGWTANDNVYTTTPSLVEPKWSPYRLFAKPGTNTYTSQVSFVLPVQGTEATTYVYVGDRWLASHLWDSPPVVLPIRLGDGTATLDWHDAWSIDPHAGTWRPEHPVATYQAAPAVAPATAPATTSTAGGGGCVFDDVRVNQSGDYTLVITYRNADPVAGSGYDSTRRGDVRVNGGEARRLSFPVTTDRRNPVPRAETRVRLEAGRPNRIEIADSAGAALAVDAITLYDHEPAR